MKRIRVLSVAVFAVCCLIFAAHAGPKMMTVQVKKTQARVKPTFLGKVLTVLNYCDEVVVDDSKGAWSKIVLPGGSGQAWVHTNVLSKKKIVLTTGGVTEAEASGEEVALAGKGFNSQIENDFKDDNDELDYTQVDIIESAKVTQAAIKAFVLQGELEPEGGR